MIDTQKNCRTIGHTLSHCWQKKKKQQILEHTFLLIHTLFLFPPSFTLSQFMPSGIVSRGYIVIGMVCDLFIGFVFTTEFTSAGTLTTLPCIDNCPPLVHIIIFA